PPGATLFPYTTLFRSRRPREHPAARARVTLADRFVIRVEEEPVARVERRHAARREDERLEEPRRVRAVPLRRARARHRLKRLIRSEEHTSELQSRGQL